MTVTVAATLQAHDHTADFVNITGDTMSGDLMLEGVYGNLDQRKITFTTTDVAAQSIELRSEVGDSDLPTPGTGLIVDGGANVAHLEVQGAAGSGLWVNGVQTSMTGHDHDADYEPSGALATHTADVDAHHTRYTDGEAVSATASSYDSAGSAASAEAAAKSYADTEDASHSTSDRAYTDTGLSGKSGTGHTHTGSTISALDTGDTTTGTFALARIPTGTTSSTVSLGNHGHTGSDDHSHSAYVDKTGDTMTGTLKVEGASGLHLKEGGANHAYIGWYPHSAAPSTRKAWAGFGSAGSDQFSIYNEAGGDIALDTAGRVRILGTAVEVGQYITLSGGKKSWKVDHDGDELTFSQSLTVDAEDWDNAGEVSLASSTVWLNSAKTVGMLHNATEGSIDFVVA